MSAYPRTIERALLSVTDKTGIVDFARGLAALGVEIISTGGTKRALDAAGVPVVPLERFTGMPEMLDGRVKTLHPRVHAGILARRDLASHREVMSTQGLNYIDLVVVNLYDFEGAVGHPTSEDSEILEAIDIGGPALLRAAAKNHAFVIPVVDPADYSEVLRWLEGGEPPALSDRRRMAAKVFSHTAAYDAKIAEFLRRPVGESSGEPAPCGEQAPSGEPSLSVVPALGDVLVKRLVKVRGLRYGENPHQRASFYRDADEPARELSAASVLQGKELSYNNLLDLDSALGLAIELGPTSAVYIKHNNPCGAARQRTLAEAISVARACDNVSAFGAVVALNGMVDESSAVALTESFVEACIAQGYTDAAMAVLAGKKNLRVVALEPAAWSLAKRLELRTLRGGVLVQDSDAHSTATDELGSARVVTKRAPSAEEWAALGFAWIVAKHVRSNAIVFAHENRVAAVGAGQMSRIDSVRLCVLKASPLAGTAVASDAFFPFRDGLDAVAEAGATCVVQPGGSVRDEEVIRAADEHGLAMLFTGVRHFRH